MKKNVLVVLVLVFISFLPVQSKVVRSYYRWQTTDMYGANPISGLTPGAITIEWDDSGMVLMKMGTISTLAWNNHEELENGIHHYTFSGASGIVMPGTEYTSIVFSADWSVMQINFLFGLGMYNKHQMVETYRYLADGEGSANLYNEGLGGQKQSGKCENCNGDGFIYEKLYMGNGHVSTVKRRCVMCHGTGRK
jgi:hypothetical protein